MTSRRLPALVGILVLLLGFAAVLAVAAVPDRRGGPDRATVPQRLPGFSHLTADTGMHPPGRAIAVYEQGTGTRFTDVPQVVVVGADGRTVRRVDVALRHGVADTRADPSPVSLSPDGLLIAVGEWRSGPGTPGLTLVDVQTGGASVVPLPEAAGVVPVAWSRDGRQLAYLATDVAVSTGGTSTTTSAEAFAPGTTGSTSAASTPDDPLTPGRLFVFDTRTHRAVAVPGAEGVVAAAFSPDGKRLAAQTVAPGASSGTGAMTPEPAPTVRVLERTGELVSELPVPAGTTLAGGYAWSPDGSLLAVADRLHDRVSFVSTGSARAVPAAVGGGGEVLGWLSGDEIVLPAPGAGGADASTGYRIVRADLRSVTSVPFTTVPAWNRAADVSGMSLAAALLPDARFVTATRPDRGPWPLALRLGLVVVGAGTAVLASVALRRRTIHLIEVTRVPDFTENSTHG